MSTRNYKRGADRGPNSVHAPKDVPPGIIARYRGTCWRCKQRFPAGTRIHPGGAQTAHVYCPKPRSGS